LSSPAYAGAGRFTAPQKLGLVREIVVAYLRARRRLKGTGLPATLAAIRGAPSNPRRAQSEPTYPVGVSLARAVTRTLPLLPADSRCLMRSLVLISLLNRREIGSSLVIGVRPGQRFGAHAWVEVDGRPLLPRGESEFERLVEL
jgi:hypothetical protein